MSATEVPTDNGREIPGIAEFARTATRLHPRSGAPTARDSHIGGPLWWPADEPWPHCDGRLPTSTGKPQENWTAEHEVDGPIALVGAAQLFRRDFPALPFPEGTDVLQVLLCPNEHQLDSSGADYYYGPAAHLVWRASAEVTEVAGRPPQPAGVGGEFVPRPCVLNPCQVVEYPALSELPDEIKLPLSFVDTAGFVHDDYDRWPKVSQCSKVGGWAFWWQSSPGKLDCQDCGAGLRLLLSLHTYEHRDELCSCEQDELQPAGWEFGRQGALNIFTCPEDSTHAFRLHID
ncbi:hypothetical protein [Amycolatopsis rifamycinica]|uniref:DUF1963 domain-containing protein n=1 Tax=Amycolatopsis rifamycinica TaxID=287986 RepID=A0A066UBR0_9PSEU|nr:hypothetical protein [Amycolatopsis rifamycinica]KDN21559.1 hypothetical protein DV20_13850 [Amycolatopsis rifamycinica]